MDGQPLYVKPLNVVIGRWIKDGRIWVGIEFVPDAIKRSLYGEARKLAVSGDLAGAKKHILYVLWRYANSHRYAEDRNRKNWNKRVAPPALPPSGEK